MACGGGGRVPCCVGLDHIGCVGCRGDSIEACTDVWRPCVFAPRTTTEPGAEVVRPAGASSGTRTGSFVIWMVPERGDVDRCWVTKSKVYPGCTTCLLAGRPSANQASRGLPLLRCVETG
eukprot:3251243-Prymnesium_polylepis.1